MNCEYLAREGITTNMSRVIILFFSYILLSAFANGDTEPKIEGIWINEKTTKTAGNTYLVVRGDEIQLYLESYWTAGYNQYFGGEKLIVNNSLFIHVDNYLTISPNSGTVVRYRNCPKYKLQRIKMHQVEANSIQLEIIPGSSIYNSIGFFDEKILNFKKISLDEFDKIDPIFDKVPELLLSNETKIRDCSASQPK